MKRIIIIAGIVAIMVVSIFVFFQFDTEADNEFKIEHDDPNYDFNTRIRAELTFDDGTVEEIGGSDFPLALTHSGNEITEFTWYLDAKASTPEGAEPYDICEVYWFTPKDPSNEPFYIDWTIAEPYNENDFGVPDYDLYCVADNDFKPAETEGIIEMLTVSVDSDDWRQICHLDIPLEDKFTSSVPDGPYEISITPHGYSSFAGKSGAVDYGETQSANMNNLPTTNVMIDWVGRQINVNWDTHYEFTYK